MNFRSWGSGMTTRWGAGFAITLVGALASACSVPVAASLDENEANRVFVALDRANIDAFKEPDALAEGKWRIAVAHDDVPRALAAMRDEQLPRRDPPSVLDAVGKGALVPSEAAERAQLVAGVAGDLERSLQSVDGVLSARVHLSVPTAVNAWTNARDLTARDLLAARGTASVLIGHRGPTPPLSADSVQRLVGGAVNGLLPTDVAVVFVGRPAPAVVPAGGLAHVGPIAVARTSVRQLQTALVALVALVAALAAAALVLHAQLSRARAALARDAAGVR